MSATDSSKKVTVIGGGPGGLFASRLLAIDHPDWDITVYERTPPENTFGFGVGLTKGLLKSIESADPDAHRRVSEAAFTFSGTEFRLPTGRSSLGVLHSGAIGRARLLTILAEAAEDVGVQFVRSEVALADVRQDADLVIAADGVSSATRAKLAERVGAAEKLGRGLFIWCGSQASLSGTIFMPVSTADGIFVAHAYPCGEGEATLVIETDIDTLRRAGIETTRFDEDGASDEKSLAYLSTVFADLLGGHPLLGNRSRWQRFRTVHCDSWTDGNVVLLGDACATVHPSLGSGTKVAMESAIALRDVLAGEVSDIPGALEQYDRLRRPSVDRLQERARWSQLWWESFPGRLDLSPARMAVAYLTRAGALTLGDIEKDAPELATTAVAEWANVSTDDVEGSDLGGWITRHSARVVTDDAVADFLPVDVTFDDAWGASGDEFVRAASAASNEGAVGLVIDGAESRSAVLERLALGERVRRETALPVAVKVGAEHISDAIDGLVSGRVDLVVVKAGDASEGLSGGAVQETARAAR